MESISKVVRKSRQMLNEIGREPTSRDNRLGIVLIWATAAAALVEIKSAAATREMRRKVFFMVQRNSAVYRRHGTFNRRSSSVPPCWRARAVADAHPKVRARFPRTQRLATQRHRPNRYMRPTLE